MRHIASILDTSLPPARRVWQRLGRLVTLVAVIGLATMARPSPVVGAAGAGMGGVQIKDFAFAPTTIKVGVGETLTWTNADSIPHTSTSADKGWNSGPIQPGMSFKVAFDKAGTYQYHCSFHPFMQATVVVGN